jgi:hypothetical protein
MFAWSAAGATVLGTPGLVLGLVGGRWTEALIGGAGGQLAGVPANLLGRWGAPPLVAAVGLIYGGLAGASFLGVFYRLLRFLLAHLPRPGRGWPPGRTVHPVAPKRLYRCSFL